MAEEGGKVGCFAILTKNSQSSSKKDYKRRCRVLLGSIKHCESHIRRFFELALLENASICRNYFALFDFGEHGHEQLKERQSFPEWKIQRDFRMLHLTQRKRMKEKGIYILPIGPFPDYIFDEALGTCIKSSLFDLLCRFVAVYFRGMFVKLLDVVDLDGLSCRTRVHKVTGKRQILVGDVLAYLKAHRPLDGYCMIGITWEDLYPSNEWNFVLGEASCEDGCAAISFGHYEPLSFKERKTQNVHVLSSTNNVQGTDAQRCNSQLEVIYSKTNDILLPPSHMGPSRENNECLVGLANSDCGCQGVGAFNFEKREKEEDVGGIKEINAAVIWRFFRSVSHELGHVFGITHCVFFACAMNESSSISEAEAQPLFMCPVCLRKLQKAIGFDIVSRYEELKAFLESLHDELMKQGSVNGRTVDNIADEKSCMDESFQMEAIKRFLEAAKWISSIQIFLRDVIK